jgi:hypothetical protein
VGERPAVSLAAKTLDPSSRRPGAPIPLLRLEPREPPREELTMKIRSRRCMALGLVAVALGLTFAAGACGGSVAPSPSPTATGPQQTTAYAVALEASVRNLSMAVESYYADNETYPAVVTQATVGGYISPWPDNPWTQRPIAQGTSVGDFTYTLTAGGFQLAGHKGDGTDVVVP